MREKRFAARRLLTSMVQLTGLPIKRIAIFRALKLGDFLLFTPALRALRAAFPKATIDYVGLPWNKELAGRYPHYIDNFIEFRGFPGLPEYPFVAEEIPAFLADMQRQKYDLALQMHGKGTISNILVSLFGARTVAGFASEEAYCPDRDFFLAYPSHQRELLRSLDLLKFLGLGQMGTTMEFPLVSKDYQKLSTLAAYRSAGGQPLRLPPLGCHFRGPVASGRISSSGGDSCVQRGLNVFLTGAAHEKPLAQAVMRKMTEKMAGEKTAMAIDLAGRTDIGSLTR